MLELPIFAEVTPQSWDEAKDLGQSFARTSVFRGMEQNNWGLRTSLERATDQFEIPPEERWKREKEILRTFKSRAHQYIQSPPSDDNNIEWLAQIQHHGGPTRLLDFTESFYIASFFAVERAEQDACVWVINRAMLMGIIVAARLSSLAVDGMWTAYPPDLVDLAESFLSKPKESRDLVLPILPPRLNERLAVQRGLFLFPCNAAKSFESNLCASFRFRFDALTSANATPMVVDDFNQMQGQMASIVKINLPRKWHTHAIRDLHSMNIDAASLFPGLDGFARSLSYSVRDAERTDKRLASIEYYPRPPDIKHPDN